MAGPYGRMNRDLHGQSLHIKGKLVLDENANLYVANAVIKNMTIKANLYTSSITEKEVGQGIMINGNVTLRSTDILTAPTIIGNAITTDTLLVNNDASVSGNLLVDRIAGKTTNNITIASNVTISTPGTTVRLNTLSENTLGAGVNVAGNLCVNALNIVQTNKITAKTTGNGNGLVVDTYLSKNRFGLGKVWGNSVFAIDSGNNTQVPLDTKAFESTFTTTRNILHPNGNTSVTFQTPSVGNINSNYTTAIVNASFGAEVEFFSGEATDSVIFTVLQNKTTTLDRYRYYIIGNVSGGKQAIRWSNMYNLSPDDTLDLYVIGDNVSGNLNANIVPGIINTFATFCIESFEL